MAAIPLRDSAAARQPSALRRLGGTLWAILRQRCPRCRTGRIFRSLFIMNDPCPACGLLFQREEGYFLGAMYISYPLSLALLIPLYFLTSALLPNLSSALVVWIAAIPYVPLAPAVFRYSRVLWIYYDRAIDPHGNMSGSYEKMRLKQIAAAKAERSAPPADKHSP